MVSLWRTLWYALALAGAMGLAACGDDEPSMNTAPPESTGSGGNTSTPVGGCVNGLGGDLPVVFNPMYSAYGGTVTYQLPVKIDTPEPVANPAWTAEPPSAVRFDPRPELGPGVWVITTQEVVETVQIKVEAGGLFGCATLHISPATDQQLAMGEARYNNQVTIPDFDIEDYRDEDGGLDIEGLRGAGAAFMENMGSWSCANCHGTNATVFKVEHTPLQIGGYSDEQLVQIVSQGMKPPGADFQNPFIQLSYPSFHTWDATPEEVQALVLYLRSLTPTPQGPLEFPQFGDFGEQVPGM